jgi:hypothetical protein
MSLFILSISGIYAGRHTVRSGGDRIYVHIPSDVALEVKSKRVRVTAIVNSEKCVERILHGSVITFVASLVKVGATFRINIPAHYSPMVSRISDCGSLDLWLAPHTE